MQGSGLRCIGLRLSFHRAGSDGWRGRAAAFCLAYLFLTWLSPTIQLIPQAVAQTAVLTEHNDNGRTGQNVSELLLSPGNVQYQQFGRIFTQPVDGLIVGQPLVFPGLSFPDGTTHDVVYVATQHDGIFAFDADDSRGSNSAPLWSVSLINAAAGITSVPIANFGCTGTGFTEVGITSTPVIDPISQTIYLVAKSLENGVYIFRLHALDLISGQERFGAPVVINASVGTVNFNAAVQLQRPALLLSNGVIYIGFGGNGCDTYKYYGWLMAYDAQMLTSIATFLTTPNTAGGAIWQAGAGVAADDGGDIYFATGNGLFDGASGGPDYGDSILHLQLVGSSFNVADFFTPFNQASLRALDLDLGSGGVLLFPDQPSSPVHEILAGGKSGTLYLMDRDDLGQNNPAQDNIVQSIPSATSGEIKSVPVYWNGNIYVTGDGDYIKLFPFANSVLSSAPVAQSTIQLDLGGSASLSANGATSGILWALKKGVPTLYAFDASTLSFLYSSAQAPNSRDKLPKLTHFATPTIANGRVYVGGNQQLAVYGFLPTLSPIAGNNQTAIDTTVLPIPLQILAADSYTSQPLASISVTCKDGGAGGSFATPTMITNTFGTASTTYKLPAKATTIHITCVSAGFASALLTETSVAGPPAHLAIRSGNLQTASVTTTLPLPLVVRVTDTHYVGVPGVVVSFSDNGAGGTFSSLSVNTDANGFATVSYTTPAVTGTVKINASSPGLATAKFTEYVQ